MSDEGTWTRNAFAPAHLTGFFEIHDEPVNAYRRGSRGAGLNLEEGVAAAVTVRGGDTGVQVRINGVPDDAPVIAAAVRGLVGADYAAGVDVAILSDLPASQGFGLSGAGALATTMALADLLGFPPKAALWEAHRAEVENRTGLGDVAAQYVGGAEIRVTPGAPPMGVVERFAGAESRRVQILCCVLEAPLSTATVLADAARRARINVAGAEAVERLRAEPTLARYMQLAAEFAERVGLVSEPLAAALAEARRFAPATQTMLGHALHMVLDPAAEPAVDPADVAAALADHGRVVQSRIALRGAHVLAS